MGVSYAVVDCKPSGWRQLFAANPVQCPVVISQQLVWPLDLTPASALLAR